MAAGLNQIRAGALSILSGSMEKCRFVIMDPARFILLLREAELATHTPL
jgi:hypothetical protein